MTNDIAVRVHKDSVVQDSIYGRRVRGWMCFLRSSYIPARVSPSFFWQASWGMCSCVESRM